MSHRRRADRHAWDILQRLDGILRRLSNQVILHAVLPVQEEIWRSLKAAAQRDQQTIGDVARREPALCGLGAVYLDVKSRVIEILLNARIGQAWHMAKLPQQLVGELAIPVQVRSLDLDIDGRRRPEVQNLRDHIGGRGEKRDAPKSTPP